MWEYTLILEIYELHPRSMFRPSHIYWNQQKVAWQDEMSALRCSNWRASILDGGVYRHSDDQNPGWSRFGSQTLLFLHFQQSDNYICRFTSRVTARVTIWFQKLPADSYIRKVFHILLPLWFFGYDSYHNYPVVFIQPGFSQLCLTQRARFLDLSPVAFIVLVVWKFSKF